MDKKEAVYRALRYNSNFRRIIDRLCKWDNNLTVKEFIFREGMSYHSKSTIDRFIRHYHLKFVRVRQNLHLKKNPNELRLSAMRKLKREGWTYEMIAKCFKCTRQNVEAFLNLHRNVLVGR